MSLKTSIDGTYDLAALERLTFPVAWSGTKDKDEARSEEMELRELVKEARETLETAYQYREDDEAEMVVRIKDGEVVGVEDK